MAQKSSEQGITSDLSMNFKYKYKEPIMNNFCCLHYRNLPGDPTNYKVLVSNATAAIGVVTGVISAHKEKLASDPSAPRTDFVDHYLDRISEGKEATNTGMWSL